MRFTSRTTPLPASSSYSMTSLSRRMAVHIAAALMVFTIIQLWATAIAIDAGGPRWMPFIGLAVLVLGAIPSARVMERRWRRFTEGALPNRKLVSAYRRDLTLLWMGALLVPLLWVVIIAEWFSSHAITF